MGVVEKYTWGLIKVIFEMGRCVQKAPTALKQLLLPLRNQRLGRQHMCICLVERKNRHDCAESFSITAGHAAGSTV